MLGKLYSAKIMRPVRTAYRYFRYGKLPPFAKPRFFLNNSRGSDTACFVLAGYKPFTWEIVFKRIKAFCPAGIDVCIVSSGVYSEELKARAEKYGWSYISMKRNCVTLALNSAIAQFPGAQNIFKLDEDIFVTEGFFETLPRVHESAKKDYFPAFTAPLIPINGYGYRRILEKLDLVGEYTDRFEYPRVSAGAHMQVESNPRVAEFFWNGGNIVPQIDALNRKIKETNIQNGGGVLCVPCPLLNRSDFLREGSARGVGMVSRQERKLHGGGRGVYLQPGDIALKGDCRRRKSGRRAFKFRRPEQIDAGVFSAA